MPGTPDHGLRATYRLQLGRRLTFRKVRLLLPYFEALGISDLYLSPILKAREGSTHGYDVVDCSRIDPALGTGEDFVSMSEDARRRGIGLVQDIVPNHMAACSENPWWADLLEAGRESPFARHFDVDWSPARPDLRDRVLVPILGDRYGRVLLSGQLALVLDDAGLGVTYYEHRLPLSIESYHVVLSLQRDVLLQRLGPEHPAVRALSRLRRRLAGYIRGAPSDPEPSFARAEERRHIKQALALALSRHPELRRQLSAVLRVLNGRVGDPASYSRLDRILGQQHYRLSFWKRASEDINYRRFFNVNDLVSVRVEDSWVFEERHRVLFRHAAECRLRGVRVDHVDGLADPQAYLSRLSRRLPRSMFLVVEKILARGEPLEAGWPVAGTTGYDFLNDVNGVFVDGSGFHELRRICSRFTGERGSFAEIAREARRQVIRMHFNSEMESLGLELGGIAARDPEAQVLSFEELIEALLEVTIALPVYRTYARGGAVDLRNAAVLTAAVREAARAAPSVSRLALSFLERVLRLEDGRLPANERRARAAFVTRWQQFTGPVMAKGVEDTALYRYAPLIGLNEVGGDPEAGAVTPAAFHAVMRRRAREWPRSMNATATHDTKRGEDARARLAVLAEEPEAWERALRRWSRAAAPFTASIGGRTVPSAAEQTFLYQTLVGAWPPDGRLTEALRERLRRFVVKAAREAKVGTSWLKPDAPYERAMVQFLDGILTPSARNRFLPSFERFVSRLGAAGATNGLSQLLVKLTAPGVPDVYQGCELWDHRLVDPDNRGPIDFRRRIRHLSELAERDPASSPAALRELVESWADGRIKLFVLSTGLGARRRQPELFAEGDYLPLVVKGPRSRHVLAFARCRGRDWAIAVAPRLPLTLGARLRPLPPRLAWTGTRIELPASAPARLQDLFTGREVVVAAGPVRHLRVGDLLSRFPVALLLGKRQPERVAAVRRQARRARHRLGPS